MNADYCGAAAENSQLYVQQMPADGASSLKQAKTCHGLLPSITEESQKQLCIRTTDVEAKTSQTMSPDCCCEPGKDGGDDV